MRTKLSIASEGDMEYAIMYLTRLAKKSRKIAPTPNHTFAEIEVSSEGMMHIFMSNLFRRLMQFTGARDNGIELTISIKSLE